jgi:hypothetical protein
MIRSKEESYGEKLLNTCSILKMFKVISAKETTIEVSYPKMN